MKSSKEIMVCRSCYPVKDTADRLQDVLQQRGATIYSRIDQQVEGARAGLHMLPLEIILFGNPKAGVPIMQQNPLAALDLPLKIIVWEDEQQRVWAAHNKSARIRKRYGLSKSLTLPLQIDPVVEAALLSHETDIKNQKKEKQKTSFPG